MDKYYIILLLLYYGGGSENIPLKPPRFGCNSRNQYFRSFFVKCYYKRNKLEHFSKCSTSEKYHSF